MRFLKQFLGYKRALSAALASKINPNNRWDVFSRTGFLKVQLCAACAALLALLGYIFLISVPGPVVLGGIGVLLLPIATSLYLRRSDNMAGAQFFSAMNLLAIVTYVSLFTGGAASFLSAWFAIPPLEAALSGARRWVVGTLMASCGALTGLFALSYWGYLPQPRSFDYDPVMAPLLGTLSAIIYAGGLALLIHRYHMRSRADILDSEQRYRLLTENAGDIITRHDETGRIIFAAGAVERILSCGPHDLKTEGLENWIHPDDIAAYHDALKRPIEGNAQGEAEFRLVLSDTEADPIQAKPVDGDGDQWFEMRCRPVTELSGCENLVGPRHAVAVTRDITERKQRQLDLKAARDEAEKANLAKTRFLATMSHELRTPLNAIIGFSEVLGTQCTSADAEAMEREYIDLIHESGIHLLNVVNGLLDMSKIESGKMQLTTQEVDIRKVITAAMSLMQKIADEAGVTLEYHGGAERVQIEADQQACQQMVLNLVSNAVKFSNAGDRVIVSTRTSGAFLEICIEDQGIGVPADILPKLAEPFVQVENTYSRKAQGTGLGLSIVRGLAMLHGGELVLTSEAGQGTQAVIRLPFGKARKNTDGGYNYLEPGVKTTPASKQIYRQA